MNTTGKLKELNPSHLDFQKILELDQNQFPRPWSESDWNRVNWDYHFLFGWERESEITGFALFSIVSGDDLSHLLKICVETRLRGQGVSQAFWGACLKELQIKGIKSVYLEVDSLNERAIGFYRKLSFSPLRTIKNYYSDGANAVTMQLII